MPREHATKKFKEEWAFYINDKGWIQYNDICKGCKKDCKQSFRVTVMQCPLYERNTNE